MVRAPVPLDVSVDCCQDMFLTEFLVRYLGYMALSIHVPDDLIFAYRRKWPSLFKIMFLFLTIKRIGAY